MTKSYFKLPRLLIYISLILWPKFHLGQTLTISELIKFRSMDNDDLNDILVAKGWGFVNIENDRMTWAFSKRGEKANAWFYKDKTWENKSYVEYNFCNTRNIGALKSQLSTLGFTKKKSSAYNSIFYSEYVSSMYLISITYKTGDPDNYTCDSYTILLEKRKTLKELQKEEKELEEIHQQEIRNRRECEINKIKRDERNTYFLAMVNKYNFSIDSVRYSIYQKNQQYLKSLNRYDSIQYEEKRVKDSTEAAERMADSLAAMEASIVTTDWIPPPLKYGVTKQSVLIFETSDEFSKAKSGLYKNERVKIIDTLGDYYMIRFDFCNEETWDDSGYVRKSDLILESQKNSTKTKNK